MLGQIAGVLGHRQAGEAAAIVLGENLGQPDRLQTGLREQPDPPMLSFARFIWTLPK